MLHVCSILVMVLVISNSESTDEKDSYDHVVWLGNEKAVKLSWSACSQDRTVRFEVESRINGWIGLGLLNDGDTGILTKKDIWIGWINEKGIAKLKDCHSDSKGHLESDFSQDLHLIENYNDGETFILKFERDIDTYDIDDVNIKEGTNKVIFGWNAQNVDEKEPCSMFRKKDVHFGTRSLNFLQPTNKLSLPPGTKHIDIKNKKITVPPVKTAYWCSVFDIADLTGITSTKHIVAIEPLVQKSSASVVHHMVLYTCSKHVSNTKRSNFTGLCFEKQTPNNIKKCTAGAGGIFAWAPGISNFEFPESAGYPIKTGRESVNFILQIHFSNTLLKKGILDSSGLRIYYAEPRRFEAAMLTVGIRENDDLLIPPGMDQWTVKGVCTKDCLQKMTPLQSIYIFASFPHGHMTLRKIRTSVVRNEVEIKKIVREDNFDFHYQRFHILEDEVEVKPGDSLITYCTYNTIGKKFATIGGLGSDKEMCLNFMLYYPSMTVVTCESDEATIQPFFTAKFATLVYADLRDTTNDVNNWQFANWTGVRWTKAMKKELYDWYNKDSPRPMIKQICLGENGKVYNMPAIYRPRLRKKRKNFHPWR